MSANAPNIYGQQFALNVQLLLQQKESRLRSLVMNGGYKGKSAQVVDQVGAVAMKQVMTRFEPIVRTDALIDSRWVSPADYDLAQMVDHFDKLKILADPGSVYVQNSVQAANRQLDDIIIPALLGTSLTGVSGTTPTALPAGQIVAVTEGGSSNTGLTAAKLRAARKLFRKAEVDLDTETLTCVITAEQEDDLFQESVIINKQYNAGQPVLEDGKIVRWLGFNFVHSERLAFSSGVIRQIPVFCKSGVHLGLWEDIQTDVSQRKDLKGQPWQVYCTLSAGATRVEEKKMVSILCDES